MRPFHHAAALAAALLALAAGCERQGQAGQDPLLSGARKREAARVLVEPVEVREMARRLETTTRVESEQQVVVFPRASGVVVELLAEEGDRVEAGQVLARLDDRSARIARSDAASSLAQAQDDQPRLEVAVREAESRLANARLAFEQAARDHERNLSIAQGADGGPGLISRKDLDASQLVRDQREGDHNTAQLALQRAKLEQTAGAGAVERARLALEKSELELSFHEIRAPFAGVIAERSIDAGDTLATGGPAFTLTDPDRLQVVFYRPQRELLLFQGEPVNGQGGGDGHGAGLTAPDLELTATAEALPGRLFRGEIQRVAPTIDPASGNFRVTASLRATPEDARQGGRLLPGMLVRLEIVTERRPDALVVPKRALRREGDRDLVFIVADGAAHAVEVEEGFRDLEHVELRSEDPRLAAGAQVVVVGNRDLEDGAPVQVGGARPAAPAEQEAPADPAAGDDPAEAAASDAAPAAGDGDGEG